MILTYAFGFNMLASYNLQSTFSVFSFYEAKMSPWIIGGILAVLTGWCLLGGGSRIVKVTSMVVPVMGIAYIGISLLVVIINIQNVPAMFVRIFEEAFDFKAIFGAFSGSAMMQGIRRGLYSNEAGIGSAPNASASANVSHPVKQGLVQMLSVFIDTLLLCTATAMMCMSSGSIRQKNCREHRGCRHLFRNHLVLSGRSLLQLQWYFLHLQLCSETVSIVTIF